MHRSKDKPQLYEVLRRMGSEAETPEAGPAAPKRPVPPEAEPSPIVLGKRPFLRLSISLPAGAAIIVVLAIVVVIAFLLGSYVARTPGVPPPPAEAPQEPTGEVSVPEAPLAPLVAQPTRPPGTGSVFYAVRCSTMAADQYVAAQRLAAVLESETGEKPWVRSTSKQLILYVGRYASQDNPDLRRLEQKVKSIRAGRRLLFPDAYSVQLTSRPAD
ncbi:MAG: hypothetical protein V2A58_00970 [Planctomycetota bacterium]